MATSVDVMVDVDDTSWMQELESALLSECDLNTLRQVSKMKPVPECFRAYVWKISLGVKGKELGDWDEIYDLSEQSLIRKDCQTLVDRFGNDEEEKVSVLCDLESVLTRFCKTTGLHYESSNGWMEVLEPLIALHLSKEELYICFHALITTYVPRHCVKDGAPFHLLRLLLLYHDPELCSFLDTMKITPDCYALPWFRSLFSSTCDLKVIQNMWDIYLQLADPFLLFSLSLVLLANTKEEIMSRKGDSKAAIIELISSAPCALEAEDIEDFCSLAQFYSTRTPLSFSREHHAIIFGSEECVDRDLPQALCLPVCVSELVTTNKLDRHTLVRYFVVDCRPADQYNSGHLKTAFHLDASLMLQEPRAFETAVQALFAAQKQAMEANSVASGEHLCFMGSGREEEDQYVHMVISSFLQKHLQYVSLVRGGYKALHDFISEDLDSYLADHSPRLCIVCSSSSASSTNGMDDDDVSFLAKVQQVTTVFKSRASDMKGKLVDYITNPQQPPVERHVSSSDKLGKRYRGMAPVFSIDDEHDDFGGHGDLDVSVQEEENISTWVKKPEVLGHFKCEEIKENGHLYPSHLLVTDTHLYLLRELSHKKGTARVVSQRPLLSVLKITSKKQHPELITFKYGLNDNATGTFTVVAMERLLIPKAKEATQLVKAQITKLLEETDAR
ncbi:TBC1 domain family member 23 [Dermacentor andersoni]|uniref:TBC1 domain family member 23 n=1 Tax=Dermacentor andersoni TaxID=34620 RepID=UPI003B3B2DE8